MTVDPFQHSPWDFWSRADDAARERQREAQRQLLAAHPDWRFGDDCFVSDLASVDADALSLGARTYLAAGAYLTGTVALGRDVSVNAYTVVRGDVTIGDAVRIGAHTSILGFNHTMSDPDIEVRRQPLTSKGIRIGDDVWIGSHVVVLDGITVGAKAVLAAGAVVTKDVPAGAVVGGTPARVLKWRVPPASGLPGGSVGSTGAGAGAGGDLVARLRAFGDAARADADRLLARAWNPDAGLFADRPGTAPTVRAQCDAIELSDLLRGAAPAQLPDPVGLLRGWQDPVTGRVGRLDAAGAVAALPADDGDAAYHVLCVGYALDLLGSAFRAPLTLITDADPGGLVAFLDALPWDGGAWNAGHWVDAVGTALLWTRRRGDAVPAGVPEALVGWLATRVDPRTGLWGSAAPGEGDLEPVNGFYRASRGTLAQFGLPVPHPERVIDTVLAHARDPRWFTDDRLDACNVLDIAHPLWLTRASGHRADEVRTLATAHLDGALRRWVDGAGFAFRVGGDPGLQGTEMWLAIIWYLADLLGHAPALGYRPRGVHRPSPADTLP
ncbi:acyltransferase [Microbacterium sp. W1N]|uniref:acyltransferase n=1 Tax=Microbacterium festucae TaxID=2977531 RepID=UPI0021BE2120|nr:acyltransferase [Microbacterium festucae]MCT9821313.1 acyltransferase [Microbacterium festucae]